MIKKTIITTLLAIAMTTQSGCLSILGGGDDGVRLNPEGKVVAGRNRNDAYVGAKEAESMALQEAFKAKNAQAQSLNTPTVVTTVTFDDNDKPVYTTTINLNGLLVADTINDGLFGYKPQKIEAPKSAGAEFIGAAGDATSKIAESTLGKLFGISVIIEKSAEGAGERNYVQEGDREENEYKVIGDGTINPPPVTEDTITEPRHLPID